MIGIIVANVPEGLLVTVTVALTLTAKNMAVKNVLVKNVETVETLGAVTVICSDKTGTLTQNRMTVRHAIYSQEQRTGFIAKMDHPAEGTPGNTPPNEPEKGQAAQPATLISPDDIGAPMAYHGSHMNVSIGEMDIRKQSSLDLSKPALHAVTYGTHFRNAQASTLEFGLLLRCAALCNHARFTEKKGPILRRPTDGDASESALLKFTSSHMNVDKARSTNIEVACVAFNSTNKFMLTIHRQPGGRFLILVKGAPEKILPRCSRLVNGTQCDEDQVRELQQAQLELASNGERVLGFAQLELSTKDFPENFNFETDGPTYNFPMEGLQFIGMLSLEDPPREEVPFAVANCQSAGIKVVMVTGDHPLTARSIATQVGIVDEEVGVTNVETSDPDCPGVIVSGSEVDDLLDEQWDFIMSRKQIVFARTLPAQKQTIVAEFQKRGHIVAVTGDGVNDSPALKKQM
eukprot:GHVR01086104.1.p1 GENE.GHVR01086104.1~~GHVR01086104.1.p1  ORF type:complete len:461 (+),score=101.22 GHVR01086104.1:778-2160(+)